jgi:aminoglycoside phosphotransferase (APT) family kinase protein
VADKGHWATRCLAAAERAYDLVVTSGDGPFEQGGIPPAEVAVDEPLIRGLLRAQHPDLAGLSLRHAATGWDNVTYRLGDQLAVRLPRIAPAAELILLEQTWLPRLAGRLPVPVPVPVRQGRPGPGFGWPWSVVPWTVGRTADREPMDAGQAGVFGRFLASLHGPPPPGFPRNDYRGIPLSGLAGAVQEKLAELSAARGSALPVGIVRDRWEAAVAAPADVADCCIHGDLHPRNLVVRDGRLAAVLDWGDMTGGDPAADLGAAWMLFPVSAHAAIWTAYGQVTASTLARATGWAVFFCVNLLLGGDPELAGIGRRALERVCTSLPAVRAFSRREHRAGEVASQRECTARP